MRGREYRNSESRLLNPPIAGDARPSRRARIYQFGMKVSLIHP